MKSKLVLFFTVTFLSVHFSFGQMYNKEIGVEITGASGSKFGGIVGGVFKFSLVNDLGYDNYLAFGPSLRYQYFWNNSIQTGEFQGSGSVFGFGGFLHYRLFKWFYLGLEPEIIYVPRMNKNASAIQPVKRWTPVGFLGGGIHKDFDFVHLNAGLMYDVIDALRDPLSQISSPLSNSYFIRRQNPNNQQEAGGYIPIIARITFFFPLGRN